MSKRIEKWKVLNSRYLVKRPWLTARCDCVELPSGMQLPEYYVLEYPDWVNVIAVTRDGRFVFVEQYRHGLGEVSMELCAGVCESSDADSLESARRELLEETGYAGGTWERWMTISPNPGTHTNLSHCFVARDVELVSGQHLDATEDIAVHLLTADEVVGLLTSGRIRQALMAAPLWKYVATHHLL
ncbi:MAG TPA: NUDIX hydrolase [Candidatus Avibacteroides faecavium]|nr:NUDIX hydrolase [Candidatus Avibacteroides faecavium]